MSGPCGLPPDVVACVPPMPPYVNVLASASVWTFCPETPSGARYVDRKRLCCCVPVQPGAFRAGHPVYFAGFTATPLERQRIEDVARAFTIFIDKVAELHPAALGKPFVFGNCLAGWHAMMAACMRPGVVGPMVIAGAPLS